MKNNGNHLCMDFLPGGYSLAGVIDGAPVNIIYATRDDSIVKFSPDHNMSEVGSARHAQDLVAEDARNYLREHSGGIIKYFFETGFEEIAPARRRSS